MEPYSFIGREGIARYEVTADPGNKTAKLRIHPAFGTSDLTHHDVTFSLDEARRVTDLILKADQTEKWLEKNQELFVTSPEP